ncbi:MAG: hypothetical protein BYD32DRAFT_191048 [Podila humilis]|nr:MAG: hypothetical protein BYD32DRAFT_191048 [Podila humilis]
MDHVPPNSCFATESPTNHRTTIIQNSKITHQSLDKQRSSFLSIYFCLCPFAVGQNNAQPCPMFMLPFLFSFPFNLSSLPLITMTLRRSTTLLLLASFRSFDPKKRPNCSISFVRSSLRTKHGSQFPQTTNNKHTSTRVKKNAHSYTLEPIGDTLHLHHVRMYVLKSTQILTKYAHANYHCRFFHPRLSRPFCSVLPLFLSPHVHEQNILAIFFSAISPPFFFFFKGWACTSINTSYLLDCSQAVLFLISF